MRRPFSFLVLRLLQSLMRRVYAALPHLARLSRPLALGSLALGAGVLAAVSLSAYLRDREQALEARTRLTMVERVVAAQDLPAGTRLTADHLAVRSFPMQWVGSDTLPIARHGELEGRVLSVSLRGGDAVLPVHTLPPQPAFSAQLAPGRRAITLPVDQVNALSGLLKPGDLIDLYVSFEHQRKRLTAPLLQSVLVLATGRETRSDSADGLTYSTVTLDASPDDVVKLVAARQTGTLTAILRHPDDVMADRRAARGDLAALLGLKATPPAPSRRPVILYGSSTARPLPSWASGRPATLRLPNGWFDLPEDPVQTMALTVPDGAGFGPPGAAGEPSPAGGSNGLATDDPAGLFAGDPGGLSAEDATDGALP